METVLLTLIASSSAAASFVLLPGAERSEPEGNPTSFTRVLEHFFMRGSRTRLVRLLVSRQSFAAVCDVLAEKLIQLGIIINREAAAACYVTLACIAALLGAAAARALVGALVMLGVAALLPLLWKSACERAAQRNLLQEIPSIFRTLAVALSSGKTLHQAIAYVGSHGSGVASAAFARAALRMRCGISAQESLNELARDVEAPGMGLLVMALIIAQRTGSPLRSLFLRSAELVERSREFEQMLAVKTAQVRLSVRIVCAMPVVMLALLSMISPDFQRGLATWGGLICVLVAAVLDAGAIVVIRRLMRTVLAL